MSAAQPDLSGPESYPRQAARTRRFNLGVPRAVTVSPDGRRVVFLRSQAGDDPAGALHVVDVATEQERLLADPRELLTDEVEALSPAERARRERMREVTSGVVGYSTDLAVTRAAFALSGRLYVVDLVAAAAPRRLPVPGPVVDPRLSPDGEHVAYVAGGAVRVVAWDGSDDRRLAAPEAEAVTYGLADFVAAEELGRSRGLWWSPASDALLVERVDETEVPLWWIADPVHPEREPTAHRYPAAGSSNAALSVHLLRLDGATAQIDWDHETFCYLADVSWTSHGDPLLVLLDRVQRRRLVLAVDPGSCQTRAVAEHTDEHWVDTAPGLVQWAPGGRLLAVGADYDTDTYRLTADGAAIGERQTNVVRILDVGERTALLLLQTHPTRAKVAELDLVHGTTRRISRSDAWESGSRGGGTVVVASTTWKSTRTAVTVHRADETSFELRSLAETPVLSASLRPGATLLLAGARELATAVLFPRDHVPGSGRLPVVMSPYGGPGHAEVVAGLGRFGEEQWLADQGFVVVIADGRGTPGRGPRWDRAIAGDLATFPLQDQVDALPAVAEAHPDDSTRAGSASAAGRSAATWRRSPCCAGPTSSTSRSPARRSPTGGSTTPPTPSATSGTPTGPAGLRRQLAARAGARLSRPLLLIHGLTDDNVVVAHTLALSGALTAAGRPHTVIPLSGVTHMTPDEVVAENKLRLELDFLRTHLQP